MAPPSKKSRTQKAPPAKEESTPMDPTTKKKQIPKKAPPTKNKESTSIAPDPTKKKQTPIDASAKSEESTSIDLPTKMKQTPKKAPPTKNKESTSIEPPTKKKRTPVDPSAKSEESTLMDPTTKKKQIPKKALPTKNKESTSVEPDPTNNKKKQTPIDASAKSEESTSMGLPTKMKQTPKKAPPTKNKESTSIEPPTKKKQTPVDPSAKTEESTPIDPPTKKKVTPKAPPAKKDPTSKSPAKKKPLKTPAPSTNEMAPVASSSTAGQRVWKCPTGPMTEEHIQRILDKLQTETIHSYKCKQKKLKDLKAMNEMITLFPHRLEQPNAFYNNRGRTSLYFTEEIPDLITPLGDAVCRGHLKCAEILLSRGANPNALSQPKRGITILEALMLWSEIPNHLDMLSLLVSHGALPLPADNNGRDLLYEAVRLGEMGTVQFLLDHGLEVKNADPDTVFPYPFTKTPVTSPLQKALYGFHFDIAKLLLLHGATFSRNDWRCGKAEEKLTIPELLVNIIITSREELWYFPDKKDKQTIAIEKAPLRLLTSLKMYRIFGGSLGNILDYLNTVKKGEVFNSVRAELQELVSHPLNLKSMARLIVKKCMGKDYLKNIKNLAVNGLPDEVEQFLRFEDVVTEC